jgi:hypothetical protein
MGQIKETLRQQIRSKLHKGIFLEKSFEIDTSNWPEKIKAFFKNIFRRAEKKGE